MERSGDYALKQEIFDQAVRLLGVTPTVDLFASQDNRKVQKFVALPRNRSVGASHLDAFSRSWTDEVPYIFPSLSLLPRALNQIRTDGGIALVVAPVWIGQPWWSLLVDMAVAAVILGKSKEVLIPGPVMVQSNVKLEVLPGRLLMALVCALPDKKT
jgi:hypothetical protein